MVHDAVFINSCLICSLNKKCFGLASTLLNYNDVTRYFNCDILIGAEIIGQTRHKTQHLVILLCISHVSIQISQLFSIYVGAVHSTVALRALVLKQNAHAFVTIHFVFVVSIFENAWCNVVLLLGGFIHSCLIFSLDQKMLSSCINLAEIQTVTDIFQW